MKFKAWLVMAALTSNAWALGGYGSLTGDDKAMTDRVMNNLQISEEDAYQLYENFLKSQLKTKNWQANSFNNETLKTSKVGDSKQRVLHINFVTDNRYVNMSFTKFNAQAQVLVQVLETLVRDNQQALQKHNELSKDDAWTVDADHPEFSSFSKKGSSDRVKVLVHSGVGGIQYVDLYSYDLKNP